LKEKHNKIQWEAIVNLRHRLAHDYRGSDPDILWQIIQFELHSLKKALVRMIDHVKFEDEMLISALNSEYYKHLGYLIDKK
jgi:uncharacterized protein with HEPN domain